MLIKIKGRVKQYNTEKLKPSERLESLWERNNSKSGESKADDRRQRECERITKQAQNDS